VKIRFFLTFTKCKQYRLKANNLNKRNSEKRLKILQNKSFFEDTWGSYADNLILKSEGWKVETTIQKGAELTVNSAINDKKKN